MLVPFVKLDRSSKSRPETPTGRYVLTSHHDLDVVNPAILDDGDDTVRLFDAVHFHARHPAAHALGILDDDAVFPAGC